MDAAQTPPAAGSDEVKPVSKFVSSGTRRGNGAGHGGPAKGAGRVTEKAPEFAKGNKAACVRKAKGG